MPSIVRSRLARIAWVSYALALLTGAGWLGVQTSRMTELPLSAILAEGGVWNVLSNTDFGNVWEVRTLLAALVAGTLLSESRLRADARVKGVLSMVLAMSLVASLAFAGHAAAGSDVEGTVHLVADILHLVAAASWLGALFPLAVLLHATAMKDVELSIEIARVATLRFSGLGIASVGTLFVTGIVNSWFLLGKIDALIDTEYGRLLLLKVLLFFAMLSIAAFNRFHLTPRMMQKNDAAPRAALRQLRTNSVIEAVVGLIILFLVGMLGTLPPGSQE